MLWIATQDDKSLINAQEITVDGKKIEGVMGSASMDYWGKTLGKYESNERALEVRNEIFAKIGDSNSFFVTYIMPQR